MPNTFCQFTVRNCRFYREQPKRVEIQKNEMNESIYRAKAQMDYVEFGLM